MLYVGVEDTEDDTLGKQIYGKMRAQYRHVWMLWQTNSGMGDMGKRSMRNICDLERVGAGRHGRRKVHGGEDGIFIWHLFSMDVLYSVFILLSSYIPLLLQSFSDGFINIINNKSIHICNKMFNLTGRSRKKLWGTKWRNRNKTIKNINELHDKHLTNHNFFSYPGYSIYV